MPGKTGEEFEGVRRGPENAPEFGPKGPEFEPEKIGCLNSTAFALIESLFLKRDYIPRPWVRHFKTCPICDSARIDLALIKFLKGETVPAWIKEATAKAVETKLTELTKQNPGYTEPVVKVTSLSPKQIQLIADTMASRDETRIDRFCMEHPEWIIHTRECQICGMRVSMALSRKTVAGTQSRGGGNNPEVIGIMIGPDGSRDLTTENMKGEVCRILAEALGLATDESEEEGHLTVRHERDLAEGRLG